MFSSNNSQVSNDAVFVEDIFSTYLYTGNGSTQTITNGIDLAGKGGMVWIKSRSVAVNHALCDTARGRAYYLISDGTFEQQGPSASNKDITSFNSNGFSLGPSQSADVNTNAYTFASWTFRKQPKFFDVVTYTGNGTAGRQIAHSLGSTPGFLVVKNTATSGTDWNCWHTSIPTSFTVLNATYAANAAGAAYFGNGSTAISPTSTVFTVSDALDVNASGQTYVAYLFAHNAGGFGLTGTDNVISCGSFTCDGSGNATVDLGYEPQWILRKASNEITNWELFDNMRGLSVTDNATKLLYPNLSNAEENTSKAKPTATGFIAKGEISKTYIYIAIRRGPMKVPTSGTSVFYPNATSGTTNTQITTNFPLDLNIVRDRTASTGFQSGFAWSDRLRELSSTTSATTTGLQSTNANAETTGIWGLNKFVDNIGFKIAADYSGLSQIYYSFRRAPSFFDEVCYTGTGNAMTVNHNLGVTPELMIVKGRSGATGWVVYTASTGATKYMRLDNTNAAATLTAVWNDTSPTSSVFTVGSNSSVNTASATYVAYLFATCAGVSKVTSFTGNGSTQTINCGFTGGARFVMIKAVSTTGDWMVADSARGIVSGSDPYLELNNTNAEVTGEDWLDTDSTGFVVNEVSGSNANTNGVTYIYLAIA